MAKSNHAIERLPINKTYKIYLGGKFPRSESGRYYLPGWEGADPPNFCLCSRKDLRDAVLAARSAQSGWVGLTAYNRAQILYRVAEMMESRRGQFVAELRLQGLSESAAAEEFELAVDRWIYYAGWCDKFQQVFSSVNPVASAHFNFSVMEPMGVVFLIAAESSPLLGLTSLLAPIIASGNSVVALASESKPLSAITLAEVLATSDLPGGVVNVLTGCKNELVEPAVAHMDVNAVGYDGSDKILLEKIQQGAISNIKRVSHFDRDWSQPESHDPYLIQSFCEVKTTWHPIERIGATGSTY